MATSRGFDQFSKRMKVRARLLGEGVERTVRKAALVVDQVAVTMTPEETGRARSNWVVSVASPILRDAPPSGGDAASQALSQGAGAIAAWRLGAGPIFISNGVPYIEQLDRGSSAQAPEGMSQAAIMAGQTALRNAKFLGR